MTPEEQHDLLIRIDENVKAIIQDCVDCKAETRNNTNGLLVLKTQAGVIGGFSGFITGIILLVIQWFMKGQGK